MYPSLCPQSRADQEPGKGEGPPSPPLQLTKTAAREPGEPGACSGNEGKRTQRKSGGGGGRAEGVEERERQRRRNKTPSPGPCPHLWVAS